MSLGLALLAAAAVAAWSLHRLEVNVSRKLSHHYGWRSVLVTGWLGTTVHELSHLLTCKLLGLRVVDYKLFSPDTRSGTLGYVYFVQDGTGIRRALGRILVGASPLLVGLCITTAGLLLTGWTPPLTKVTQTVSPGDYRSVFKLLQSISVSSLVGLRSLARFEQLKNPWFWLWSYAALCIGMHMSPSRADLKNTTLGIASLVILFASALFIVGFFAPTAPIHCLRLAHDTAVPAAVASVWMLVLALGYWGAVRVVTWLLP
jgi:hypothetical protein